MISAKLKPITAKGVPNNRGKKSGTEAKIWKTRSPQQRNLSNTWIHEIKVNKFENTSHFQALANQKQKLKFCF